MTFLETNRLRLRNVSPKDAIQMVDYRNNERCSKYQRGQTKDYKDIVTLIERNKDNALNISSPTMISVALRETDVMIGEIVIRRNHKCGSITPGLSQPQQQGLGHRTPQQESVPKGARIFNN